MENQEIMLNENVVEEAADTAAEVLKTSNKDWVKIVGVGAAIPIVSYAAYKMITKGIPTIVKGTKKLYDKIISKKVEEPIVDEDVENYKEVDEDSED